MKSLPILSISMNRRPFLALFAGVVFVGLSWLLYSHLNLAPKPPRTAALQSPEQLRAVEKPRIEFGEKTLLYLPKNNYLFGQNANLAESAPHSTTPHLNQMLIGFGGNWLTKDRFYINTEIGVGTLSNTNSTSSRRRQPITHFSTSLQHRLNPALDLNARYAHNTGSSVSYAEWDISLNYRLSNNSEFSLQHQESEHNNGLDDEEGHTTWMKYRWKF